MVARNSFLICNSVDGGRGGEEEDPYHISIDVVPPSSSLVSVLKSTCSFFFGKRFLWLPSSSSSSNSG